MSAPLVVNTNDGAVWTRREGSRDGEALYAPEKCGACPAFVMVTLTELAELGIVGSADVLPVPVLPEPQALSKERLAEIREHVAETRNWSIGNLAARDLLVEVDRLRVERDEFYDRVDTLTAVAQGNKRHVVSLTTECQRLRARVAELEAERHSTNKSVSEAAEQLRVDRDRIAELEALTPARVQTCRVCGAGYTYGEPCSSCEFRKRMAAELQARGLDGEHYASVHHDYRVGHDLPETGGGTR